MDFDIIIIGAGPGGYVAGIRASQLGFKVAVVEKYSSLGGTCLNVGCIPSKALLDSSELYHQAKEKFDIHGIGTEGLKLDFSKMMKRKDDVIATTVKGIQYLFSKNKITHLQGVGQFLDSNTINVIGKKESKKYTAKYFVIATGSKPVELPFMKYQERIICSTGALALTKLPAKMIVVGGGVIGLELGSVFARLGTEVTVVEFMPSIIATMDRELGKTLQKSLEKLGIKFYLSSKVTGAKTTKTKVSLTAEDKAGKELKFDADYVLVSVGRSPNTKDLELDKAEVVCDERGFVQVNENFATSVNNIYAIGDVIGGAMLAHKAEEEGVFVVEQLAGQKPHIDHNLIPAVVYTWPEVASVGKNEQQLKEEKIEYKVGKFPFTASGRARASEESEGFIKVLADKQTDEILGVAMIGPRCADMIAEAVVAMEYKATAEDIARICHAHPTYTESLKEACLQAYDGKALHI